MSYEMVPHDGGKAVIIRNDLSYPNFSLANSVPIYALSLDSILANKYHGFTVSSVLDERYLQLRLAAERENNLRDALATGFPARKVFDAERSIERAKSEESIFHSLVNHDCTISLIYLRNLILRIHRSLGRGGNEIRTRSLMIPSTVDSRDIVVFPDSIEIDNLLNTMCGAILGNLGYSPSLAAICAFVGIMRTHPFLDGNGATARILFNILANHNRRNPHFLPMNIITDFDIRSYIIILRRAMYLADFAPLIRYIIACYVVANKVNDLTDR